MRGHFIAFLLSTLSLLILVTACDPVPGRSLNAEEKEADMKWMFSVFGEDYAPRAYKEKRYGFDMEKLKEKYLAEAKATKTNEDFYLTMFKFVAEFKDAHTSLKLTPSGLPNRAQIAFLGIGGKRAMPPA